MEGAAPAWWRLELPCPPELEDSLLWKLPGLGIGRIALRHSPEAPEQRLLQAWLPEADWPEAQRRELLLALEPLGEPFGLRLGPARWIRQPEEDWSLSWKQHWQPDPVGERMLILPAWLDLPAEHAGRLVIHMDPGSAFGTGSHPTTRLCLEGLERLALERGGSLAGLQVADLGCGSGVLGLAALALGADGVTASDTDSLAVRATGSNARLNGAEDRLAVVQGSLEALAEALEARQEGAQAAARPGGAPADLLLCNILAPVIEALCPGFVRLLAPGGIGLLSGLLVDQAPALIACLEAEGWRAQPVVSQDRWGLLQIERRPDVA